MDNLSVKVFGKSSKGDESDAFRHFLWSALLTKELGPEKAQLFLDAHENDPSQSSKDKAMDVANNKSGLEYMKGKKSSPELNQIEKEALDRLRSGKLKFYKKTLEKVPGGYYSN